MPHPLLSVPGTKQDPQHASKQFQRERNGKQDGNQDADEQDRENEKQFTSHVQTDLVTVAVPSGVGGSSWPHRMQ